MYCNSALNAIKFCIQWTHDVNCTRHDTLGLPDENNPLRSANEN